jgi:phosphoribosyl 1,2-cyclic phosphodiesterase
MVRMTVLASGSRGNSTIVSSSKTRILLDAGLSCRELMKRMRAANEDPATLDAILITHEHQDHVQGLSVLARKLNIPVYFTEATHRAWVRWMTPSKKITYAQWLEMQAAEKARALESEGRQPSDAEPDCEPEQEKDYTSLPAVEYFRAGCDFSIGDIEIFPFTIPHDAADPTGFVFRAEGVRIGIATDLGYMPPNVRLALRNADVLMLESNHDLEMLRDGPYPWSVKQRVLSRVGHLSNDSVAQFLTKEYDGGAAYVVLAHLSTQNNLPELARLSAERALGTRMSLLANRLVLASQDTPTEAICM